MYCYLMPSSVDGGEWSQITIAVSELRGLVLIVRDVQRAGTGWSVDRSNCRSFRLGRLRHR